jgi:fused signal recognition particle receptor
MFDFLKKKIAAFTEKLTAKAEEVAQKEEKKEAQKPAEQKQVPQKEVPVQKNEKKSDEEELLDEIRKEVAEEEGAASEEAEDVSVSDESEIDQEEPEIQKKEIDGEEVSEEKEIEIPEKKAEVSGKIQETKSKIKDVEQKTVRPVSIEEEKKHVEKLRTDDAREIKAKVGFGTKLKAIFAREITLSEKDIDNFLDEFELALLESDVEQETARDIVAGIRKGFVGKKIPAGNLSGYLKNELRNVLSEIMSVQSIDIDEQAEKKKPYIMLFLGPNGAGKTTSMAKLTRHFQKQGKSVIWAASDTFRAASIEQLDVHAEKLNVRVVKHAYGADPAAVAFDAIKAAEAKHIDIVMIDSAGRQETNKNLLEELKKLARVAKPDVKIYVGESFTGRALLQQASKINEAVSIDGFVLTKIDCDAKGGTAISVLHQLKKPLLFVGTGQGYDDIQRFEPNFILDRILK